VVVFSTLSKRGQKSVEKRREGRLEEGVAIVEKIEKGIEVERERNLLEQRRGKAAFAREGGEQARSPPCRKWSGT